MKFIMTAGVDPFMVGATAGTDVEEIGSVNRGFNSLRVDGSEANTVP